MTTSSPALGPSPRVTAGRRAARAPEPPGPSRRADPALADDGIAGPQAFLEHIGPDFFTSLRRADQRRAAVLYVSGLLSTPGRKSARNIARTVGESAAAQRFHHFVNVSPWDWIPVRRAVVRAVGRFQPPSAWVIQQSVFPKTGRLSAGVDRIYDPDHGRTLVGQRVLGVWAASPGFGVPADWHLLMPGAPDPAQPPHDAAVTSEQTGSDELPAVVARLGDRAVRQSGPRRPLVIDLRLADSAPLLARLRALGLPFLLRVDAGLRLRVPAAGARPTSPEQLLGSDRGALRRLVSHSGGTQTVVLGTTHPVLLHDGQPAQDQPPLRLLGLRRSVNAPPDAWLTNLTHLTLPELHGLTELAGRTRQEFWSACTRVGLRDFTGRTADGWHRHLTLASAAYAVTALAGIAAGPRLAADGQFPS
ncbi:IS701 family transposase [Myceligenerans crystallogenes]|uniref:Transposase n=1 Tax=Myceligenerans crystallogenes TaxID=316335 RepID=A0ABP4ZFX0_9MICO